MECYCDKVTSLGNPFSYLHNFFRVNPDDGWRYCLEVAGKRLGKSIFILMYSIEITLVNELISLIFLRLGSMTKRYTLKEQQIISFN